MDFLNQIFILNSENLVMQKWVVGFFIFNFLDGVLLFLVVLNQLVSLSVFFFELVINSEQLLLCLKFLMHFNIITSSKIDKSISFKERSIVTRVATEVEAISSIFIT